MADTLNTLHRGTLLSNENKEAKKARTMRADKHA